MPANIHPSSVISSKCEIDPTATIGPFCVLIGKVKIGPRTKVISHSMIGSEYGEVEIGADNQIFSAAIGGPPQDLSYKDQNVKVIVGDRNIIREYVTINQGTAKGDGITKVGSDCMLMTYVHVAHDCRIADNVILANATNIAGHSIVDYGVRTGGGCLINQFTKIGKFVYMAGDATANKDVIPFTISQGKYAIARATNRIGLERAGYSQDRIDNIHRAIRSLIMGGKTIDASIAQIREECELNEDINYLIDFVKTSSRGIARE
jgi:UDP-N-acetylglucosamine acyltransferase